jgi:pyruvate dehydrogenase (quinone)
MPAAKAFMSSIAKGDEGAGHVLAETARQLLHEVLPG